MLTIVVMASLILGGVLTVAMVIRLAQPASRTMAEHDARTREWAARRRAARPGAILVAMSDHDDDSRQTRYLIRELHTCQPDAIVTAVETGQVVSADVAIGHLMALTRATICAQALSGPLDQHSPRWGPVLERLQVLALQLPR